MDSRRHEDFTTCQTAPEQIERFLFRFRFDFWRRRAVSGLRKLRDDRPLHYLAVQIAASEEDD